MEMIDNRQHFMLKLGRVQILKELSLLEPSDTTIYDQFAALASEIVGTPISMVSMVAAQHQFFQGAVGLPEAVATERQVPLSHSFCKHVVASNKPLIVNDLRNVSQLNDNPAIAEFNVIGYLGIPVRLFDERTLGSFCAIDLQPHDWTQNEIDIMTEFVDIISKEFDMRAMAHNDALYRSDLNTLHQKLKEFFELAEERFHDAEDEPEMTRWNFLRWVQRWRLENYV